MREDGIGGGPIGGPPRRQADIRLGPVTFAIAASGSPDPRVSDLRAAFWYNERAASRAIACPR
jgi:hypothetical protein